MLSEFLAFAPIFFCTLLSIYSERFFGVRLSQKVTPELKLGNEHGKLFSSLKIFEELPSGSLTLHIPVNSGNGLASGYT